MTSAEMNPIEKLNPKRLAVATGVYLLLAAVGVQFALRGPVSPIWPATGFSIFLVWRFGFAYALAPFIAGTVCNLYFNLQPLAAFSIAGANALEGILGALILNWVDDWDDPQRPDLKAFVTMLAMIAAPVATAAISSLALLAAGHGSKHGALINGLIWWNANTIGGLMFFPLFKALCDYVCEARAGGREKKARLGRDLALACALAVVFGVFAWAMMSVGQGEYFLALIPLAVLVTLRFVPDLASRLAVISVAVVAVVATKNGIGPFQHGTTTGNIIKMQAVLGTIGVAVLFTRAFLLLGRPARPYAAMLTGAALGAVVLLAFTRYERRLEKETLSLVIHRESEKVERRLGEYVSALSSAAAFWKASERAGRDVTSEEWSNYIRELRLTDRAAGLRCIARAIWVERTDEGRFLAEQRKTKPGFVIKEIPASAGARMPSNARDYRIVVTDSEPLTLNGFAIGLDLGSEPRRLEAAESAAHAGEARMTTGLPLARERSAAGEAVSGFILFLPVQIGRRTLGWVYEPFDSKAFFSGIFNEIEEGVGWTVAFQNEPGQTVYASAGLSHPHALPLTTSTLDIAGRTLVFSWYKLGGYAASQDMTAAWIMAMIILISIALATTITNIETVRDHAVVLAEKISADLEKHRSAIFHSSKMSTLGHMAAGVAHEINNPLTIIAGYAFQCLDEMRRGDTAANRPHVERLERITETVMRISKIIRGLQAFSRPGERLPRKRLALSQIVATVRDLCTTKFAREGISLRIGAAPDVEIEAVPVQIEQVLMNLLTNAYDAVCALEERWVEMTFERLGDRLAIVVTDSGTGLPTEIQARIAEPFFTTKPMGQGMGLGLSICRTLVENHGGKLRYRGGSGRTCFEIELPIAGTGPSRTEALFAE